MAIHLQRFSFIYLIIASIGCYVHPEESDNMPETIFQKYDKSALGSTKYILPASSINGAGVIISVVGERGMPQKMIDVSSDDAAAVPVCVSFRTEYDRDPNTGADAVGGPIVGIVQWGVGGGKNEVEFDIGSPRTPAGLAPGIPNFQPMNNVGQATQVQLGGTSHVSVYVRHDGSVSPLTAPGADVIGFLAGVKVIAFVSPGVSNKAPIERTIVVSTFTSPLGIAGAIAVNPPPFAKSVRIERIDSAGLLPPMQLDFFNSLGQIARRIPVPTNGEGPYPFSASTNWILVTNLGPNVVHWCSLVFDVTP